MEMDALAVSKCVIYHFRIDHREKHCSDLERCYFDFWQNRQSHFFLMNAKILQKNDMKTYIHWCFHSRVVLLEYHLYYFDYR